MTAAPTRPAGQRLSAAWMERSALTVAASLRSRGVRPGDRVLVRADNDPALVATVLGLVHLGASIVLADRDQTAMELDRRAEQARVAWWVVDHPGLGPARCRIVLAELGDAIARQQLPRLGLVDLDRWAATDDGLVSWSSGTTGPAKGIVKSGRAVLDNIRRSGERMGYAAADVLLPLVPFSHWYGLSLLLSAWQHRASLVLTPYRRLPVALEAGLARRATVVDATPATYASLVRLVDRRRRPPGALQDIRMWCVGGSPTGSLLRERMAAATGCHLFDGYGSTEAGNVAMAAPDHPRACGPALPGVRVRVLDDLGVPAAPGAIGRVVVDTPDLMTGRLAAAGAVHAVPPGPHDTGDLGHLDAEGNLVVLGRRSAVQRNGHVIYPAAVGRAVEALGCAVEVVAVEDHHRGCRLVFVVEDPALRPPRHWRDAVRALLPAYEQPNVVLVVAQLPTTRTGKVSQTAVREMVQEQVAGHPLGGGPA